MLWIQGGGWFIQDDNFRMHHQNICDGNLFFLSAGQCMGWPAAVWRDLHLIDDPFYFFLCLLFADTQI